MNGSLDVIKIVQENLDNDDLISATEIITKLDENSLQILCADLIALVASYLTVENYKENVDKYLCCENILKLIAKSATKEDALFELLEVLENVSHDEQFISVLKALQVVLIRLNHANTQAIAWVLDSIIQYINHEIDVPEILKGNIGPEEEKIIENDSVVQRLLSLYFTIFLFLDPVQQCLLDQTRNESTKIFFVHDFNSRNVISTFLLKLMEGSFAYLNYSKEHLLYARQCADNLIKLFCRNFSNPYMLLEIIEDRKAFKQLSYKTQHAESNSIFYSEDRFSMLSVGMLFYLIFVEKIPTFIRLPKVYRHEYLIERGTSIVNYMLCNSYSQIHSKGIKLGLYFLGLVNDELLSITDVETDIRKDFFKYLNNIIIFSPIEKIRKDALNLFDIFIKTHSISAKYAIIEHLFNTVTNSGLKSHIIMIYKGIIVDLLNIGFSEHLFSKIKFEQMIKSYICHLKEGEQTDLMDDSKALLSALNFLIFLMIRDKENCTGILDIINEIKISFMQPLERGLQLSQAHYKNQIKQIEEEKNHQIEKIMKIEIQNNIGDEILDLSTEKKLEIITYSLNMFDIMSRLLARLTECVNLMNKK